MSTLAPKILQNITNTIKDVITNSVEEKNATTTNTADVVVDSAEDDDSIGILREDRCNTPDSILGKNFFHFNKIII